MNKTNYSLITGASSGLGLAFAHEIAARSGNLALVALPGENLAATAAELSQQYKIEVAYLEADLCQPEAPQRVAEWIKAESLQLHSLINNAGIGGSSPFEQMGPEHIDRMIQLNVRATSLLTRQLLPVLKQQRRAYILNVASMASFSPIPFKAIYSASKGFIYAFSQALRYELADSQVSVSVINPGPIMTNQAVKDRIACHGRITQMSVLSPEEVARISLNGLYAGKARIVPGWLNQLNGFFMRNMPSGLMRKVLGGIFLREKKLFQHSLAKAAAAFLLLLASASALSAQQQQFDIYWRSQEVGQLIAQQQASGDSMQMQIKTDVVIPWVSKKLNFHLQTLYVNNQLHKSTSTYYLDDKKREDSRLSWTGDAYERTLWDSPPLSPEYRRIFFGIGKLYVKEPEGIQQVYSERHQSFLPLKEVKAHCYELSLPDGGKNSYFYKQGELVRIEAEEGWFSIRFERRDNQLTGL